MTDEQEVVLAWKALLTLRDKDRRWGKNVDVFVRQPTRWRLEWWRRVKRQAELGNPSMQLLVAEAVKIRMTS